MSKDPPLVGITAVYAAVDSEGGCRIEYPLQPAVRVPPEQAHTLLDTGPLVDIRAVATDSRWGRTPLESRWAVTVLAFHEDDALEAMDGALDQLRADLRAGRVQPGTHTGRPWPRNPLEPAAEALLRQFREGVLRELE